MYYRYKKSLASISCALSMSLLPMTFANLSATEADNTASAIAERGGSGGRGMAGGHGGDFHSGEHSNYHPEAHDNYHPNVGHDYNRDNYDRDNFNYNQFDRNAWDAGGWGAGALDVVPEGEYVYPGNAAPGSGDMNTLYDYESSTNQTSPN